MWTTLSITSVEYRQSVAYTLIVINRRSGCYTADGQSTGTAVAHIHTCVRPARRTASSVSVNQCPTVDGSIKQAPQRHTREHGYRAAYLQTIPSYRAAPMSGHAIGQNDVIDTSRDPKQSKQTAPRSS